MEEIVADVSTGTCTEVVDRGNRDNVLFGPMDVRCNDEGSIMQISAHVCKRPVLNELRSIFSSLFKENGDLKIVAVVTMQKSALDLVNFGHEVELEKNRLLENVVFLAPKSSTLNHS